MASSKATTTAEQKETQKEPTFSLAALRKNCVKVLGITSSTFDGATYGLSGEFTVAEIKEHIEKWGKSSTFKKGVN